MAKRGERVRRTSVRLTTDIERRLAEVEALAHANRRELELQFRRMAHMQTQIDHLLKPR